MFDGRRIQAQLLKGTLPLLVLATLRDGELHGYEIARRIRSRSGDAFTLSEGSLYPALHRLETDGALESAYMNLDTIRLLEGEVWGQGFPQPLFCDRFAVASQRVVADKHLKLRLLKDGKSFDAIRFNSLAPAGAAIRAVYRLAVNEYNGVQSVQLIVEEWESAA